MHNTPGGALLMAAEWKHAPVQESIHYHVVLDLHFIHQ